MPARVIATVLGGIIVALCVSRLSCFHHPTQVLPNEAEESFRLFALNLGSALTVATHRERNEQHRADTRPAVVELFFRVRSSSLAGDVGTIQLEHNEIVEQSGAVVRRRFSVLIVKVERRGGTWKLVRATDEPQMDLGVGAQDPTTLPAEDAAEWPTLKTAIDSAQRAIPAEPAPERGQ